MNGLPVFLVDSSIYVFRAWFTLPDTLQDAQGNPVNAVYGFTDFVAGLLTLTRSHPVGFAFDESLKSSFRNEIYPLYKANRDPAPEELIRQFTYCKEFIRALGFPCFSSDQYEADDLIGTVASHKRRQGHTITIISADKDLAQLIEEGDYLWDYSKDRKLDAKKVKTHYGVRPDQIADQLAIAGDSVDNIPGVPGIGMTTAARLLQKFDSIETLFEQIESISTLKMRGAKRIGQLIKDHVNEIILYKKLTTIECAASMPTDCMNLEYSQCNRDQLNDLFERLAFGPVRRERWERLLDSL